MTTQLLAVSLTLLTAFAGAGGATTRPAVQERAEVALVNVNVVVLDAVREPHARPDCGRLRRSRRRQASRGPERFRDRRERCRAGPGSDGAVAPCFRAPPVDHCVRRLRQLQPDAAQRLC